MSLISCNLNFFTGNPEKSFDNFKKPYTYKVTYLHWGKAVPALHPRAFAAGISADAAQKRGEMYSTVISGGLRGIYSYLVQVEVDTAQGLPGFEMVGYLGSEVKEAKERVRVALKNAGFAIPAERITVNISPADIPKEGTAYDLPVAVAILSSMEIVPREALTDLLMIGELGLNGELRPVRGVLPVVREAKAAGFKSCIVPKENEKEGAVVEGIDVYGLGCLQEVADFLRKYKEPPFEPARVDLEKIFLQQEERGPDFADIQGQKEVRRAAEIAAAGFHHLLMIGPPGSGKTMIAKRIPSILPPMSLEESLEVSTIYSVAGLLKEKQSLVCKRPFLSPHHTISEHALAGGGKIPRPGVLSLSHRGVLFLDELTEFKRATLEILRQPIEDKEVQIARSSGTFTYPASCLIVGAMNPCPCGYYPDRNHCSCSPWEIDRYLHKISGPVLDRMDIVAEAKKVDIAELGSENAAESSAEISERIMRARRMQQKRFQGTGLSFNADMGPAQVRKYCLLGADEQQMMMQLFSSMNLSARAYHKIIKVARTIADLEESEKIERRHLAEAACYRRTDSKYWGRHR